MSDNDAAILLIFLVAAFAFVVMAGAYLAWS